MTDDQIQALRLVPLNSPNATIDALYELADEAIRLSELLWHERFWRAFGWFGAGPTTDKYWCDRAGSAEERVAQLETALREVRNPETKGDDYCWCIVIVKGVPHERECIIARTALVNKTNK